MEQPIEKRAGEGRVGEDIAPVGERLVARDDRRAMFVPLTDELKEPRSRRLIEFDVSELVDDEQWHVFKCRCLCPGTPSSCAMRI